MKLELPLAAVLLAAGCLLWSSQIKGLKKTVAQAPKLSKYDHEEGQGSSAEVTASVSSTQFQDVQSGELLKKSAENLLNSIGIESDAKITARLFGETTVAKGKYYQMGQGTTQSRLELACGDGADAIKIVQLCDGRFYYTLTLAQNESRLEFVDLEKVSIANGPRQATGVDPSNLLATGGIACLLQNLVTMFDFDAPVATELGGVSMLTLNGTWNKERLKKLVVGLVGPTDLQPDINWEQLPPQLPHAVSITLGNDDFLPLFPYRIVFYHYDPILDSFTHPMLTVELYEVNKSARLSPELFKINSNNAVTVDSTERYVARAHQFRENPRSRQQQTANSSDSTTRK